MLKKILLALLAVLVIMQFFQIDKENPPSDPSKDFLANVEVDANMATLVKSACYDCHSHHTKYPWYTNISPVNWWIKDHIEEGRKHLNYSIWTDYEPKKQHHKLEEQVEFLEEKEMPLKSYTWVHGHARLSKEQREEMIAWTKKLMSTYNVAEFE